MITRHHFLYIVIHVMSADKSKLYVVSMFYSSQHVTFGIIIIPNHFLFLVSAARHL
jgi:hypothetical protein